MFRKLGIAADHNGFELKNAIIEQSKDLYDWTDYGAKTYEPTDDYTGPVIALCEALQRKEIEAGILMCGTGMGVCILAGKFKGVYPGRVFSADDAADCRIHNNCNVLTFGAGYQGKNVVSVQEALDRIDAFCNTDFDADKRRVRRFQTTQKIEEEQ